MSNDIPSVPAVTDTATIPQFKLRIALAVSSIAAAILPLVTMKAFGVSQGWSLADALGAIAYLIPVTGVAALVVRYHPPLREHGPLADKILMGVLGFFLVWFLYEMVQGISQIADLSRQFRGLGMPGMNFSDFGDLFRIFSPGLGLLGLLAVYALSVVVLLKTRKGL